MVPSLPTLPCMTGRGGTAEVHENNTARKAVYERQDDAHRNRKFYSSHEALPGSLHHVPEQKVHAWDHTTVGEGRGDRP